MLLEFHDNEEGNTLVARVEVDYAYQAEQHVQDTAKDDSFSEIVRWSLSDDLGVTCVWERPSGELGLPNITQRAARFAGTWEKGPSEVAI